MARVILRGGIRMDGRMSNVIQKLDGAERKPEPRRRRRSIKERREIAEASLKPGTSVRDVAQAYEVHPSQIGKFVSEWATWECTGTSDAGGAHRRRRRTEEEKPRVESATESSGSHSHRVRASAS